MTPTRPLLIAVLALALAAPRLTARDEPRLEAQLGEEQIYLGETVLYQVVVRNVEESPRPVLDGFTDCDVEFVGDKSLNSHSLRIINGQATEHVSYGHAFVFRLRPRKAGELILPKPTAVIDGTKLEGPSLYLKVLAPSDTDLARLEIVADRPSVYPQQPFTVTLKLRVRALPEPYADRSPFSIQEQPVALTIPWVEPPDGLMPAQGAAEWLSPLESADRDGFTINDVALRSSFGFFESRSTFRPEPKEIRVPDGAGGTTAGWEYTIARTFVPARAGTYTFGPATLKGMFASGIDKKRKRFAGESLFVVAPAVTVSVQDPPAEGRPPSYTGAIGTFTWRGELVPTQGKVGDPMTLTLTLRGRGALDAAAAPDLKAVPEVAARFRVYEATEEMRGGARVFTYSLRPTQAGKGVFPPVPISWFDVERERYVTVETEAIPIEVGEADQLAGGDIVSGGGRATARRTSLEARKEGIFQNVTDLAALRDDSARPSPWAAAIAALGVAYAGIAWAVERRRRWLADPALVRRRAAPEQARSRLAAARAALQAGRVRDGTDGVRQAIVGLIADVAGVEAAGLTPKDVRDRLESFGTGAELLARAVAVLEACDAVRFGAGAGSADALGAEAAVVLDHLVTALQAEGRLR